MKRDLAIGGVMRCCELTLAEYQQQHNGELEEEGTVLPCKYGCGESLIVKDGVWQWDQREEK